MRECREVCREVAGNTAQPLHYLSTLRKLGFHIMTRRNESKGRKWCFTLNNYTELEYGRIIGIPETEYKYLIVGRELCPTTGTPHLQGFVNWGRDVRFGAVRERLGGEGSRIHIERARGTDLQNQEYCKKDNVSHRF